MNELSEFLEDTVGRCLYNFWLDCESYKDTVDDINSVDSRQLRSRLFRRVSCAFVVGAIHTDQLSGTSSRCQLTVASFWCQLPADE